MIATVLPSKGSNDSGKLLYIGHNSQIFVPFLLILQISPLVRLYKF